MMHNYEFSLSFAKRPSIAMSTLPSPADAASRSSAFAPRALYEQVAERLRQQIFARELQPGSWIDEQRLALDYGISRTPLREALKVLATEGLVTMKVRRGAYVTEMSEQDVAEVYHLMSVLESDAAAEVARKASDAELQALNDTHQRLEAVVNDRTQFFAINEAFHMQVLDIAGSRWRTQIVTDLRKVMKLNRHLSLFKQGRIAESLDEHRRLVKALLARDAEAAQALVREHFRNGLAAAA
jgi:DNA-binding GntR family transcriptional regulator